MCQLERRTQGLLESANVRVSPTSEFIFCKEAHPLIRDSVFLPPSRTTQMSGQEFVERFTRRSPHPPLFYGPSERYYLQADLPPELAAELTLPPSWRALGLSAAQPPRLWVSGRGAVTPLHFDMAASFLAQAHSRKPSACITARFCTYIRMV